jgi:sugar phosphate isomerase/epimerase
MKRRLFLQGAGVFAFTQPARPVPHALSLDRFTVAGCSLTNLGFEGTLRKLLDMGFPGVEIATFPEKTGPEGQTYPYAVADSLGAGEKERVRALVKQFRHVTTHLPYYPDFRPIAEDAGLREKSRRELWRSVADSGFWGASVATVHVASEPKVAYRDAKPHLVEFYRQLSDHARQAGVCLGIETTRPYRAGEYLDLIESIDRDNLGGTVDTGHIGFFRADLGIADGDRSSPAGIRRYNDLLIETVRNLGKKLFHFHVQDVRPADWKDHFVPGTGIVDWHRFFQEVSCSGYDGLFAAELLYYEGSQFAGLEQTREFFKTILGWL